MILTKYGLHFRKDGDGWRCLEWFALAMLRGERHLVEGQEFESVAEAARFLEGE
jgi:hypothetical protein